MKRAVMIALAVCTSASAAGQKTIKDAAEYNTYIAALNTKEPGARAAAMEAFNARYPASVVHIDALEHAMAGWQQAGNQDKMFGAAEKVFEADPGKVNALAIISVIQRARATNGDKAALAKLSPNAEKGLKAVENWSKPEGMTDAAFGQMKNQVLAVFQGAAGFSALQTKDYALARDHLAKAAALDAGSMQDHFQLAIAQLELKPIDTAGFWNIARAMHLAGDNAAARKSIESYGKSRYRKQRGTNQGWDALVTSAKEQSAPPDKVEIR